MSKINLDLSVADLLKIKYALEARIDMMIDIKYEEAWIEEHQELLKSVNEYLGEE